MHLNLNCCVNVNSISSLVNFFVVSLSFRMNNLFWIFFSLPRAMCMIYEKFSVKIFIIRYEAVTKNQEERQYSETLIHLSFSLIFPNPACHFVRRIINNS